ncbi:DUF1961 family protein [uncultured Draconibacterium sp.]|uniref:DUF1961 family protein n=1 Tax=uncultured Draconibacterium sp. TaxID=1573823 RepID=UPI002AA6401D|nr:DUF1961 family protein [uncultured Draconibacterium sp.]
MRSNLFFVIFAVLLITISCKQEEANDFVSLNKSKSWNLQFEDDCTENWQQNWFKDGLISQVKQDEDGMDLIAGPVNRDDAHHTVLWTKRSFEGDIKIEYEYTRTDSQIVNVNILYIQAQGIGKDGRGADITEWNTYRDTANMWKYYFYMDPLHISYAAFPMVNDDPEDDYVRVRKYPAETQEKFKDTEVLPAYFKTGLFLSDVTYKITVIKTESKLYFNVKGNGDEKLFSWDLAEGQSPKEGRIGLRHMYTRSARYKNFKVWTK